MSVTITFTVAGFEAPKLKERIREEAIARGVSVSEWITDAIVEYLRGDHDPQ